MPLQTTALFEGYAEKNKNHLTLLVAQALMPIAVAADPVDKIMRLMQAGDVAPCVDFFCYHTTRLTVDGNWEVASPFKNNAKILVKALAYMDEAHVDYLLQFPGTPAGLNNQQFVHIPLRRILSRDYLTIPLLQTMLGKGLRVVKKEHLHETLPNYGYNITTTTLSIIFDPGLQKIPTSISMRWPSAANVQVIGANILWPRDMLNTPGFASNHNLSHALYIEEASDEDAWEKDH